MEYKDYYKTLGVEKTVGKDELKKQYRKLARQYHPDVNTTDKNAAAKFSEISEAYEVLSNDEKRKKYDAFGSDWAQHQNSGQSNEFDWSKYASQMNGQEGNPGQNWEDIFGQGSDSSDFFRSIFEQGSHGQEGVRLARKGHDLKAVLTLSLKEAYDGGDRILTIGESKIRLKLKPGIWDRQKIRIDGKGAPGINGAESGDLFITFHLQHDPEYRLEGTNLYKEIPLSIYAAMLGTSITVQTISGKFDLKIPPETKNGTVLKLKGRGFPVYGKSDSHGDLFLKVVLQLPEKLTEQEKKLIRELTALRAEKVNEKQV